MEANSPEIFYRKRIRLTGTEIILIVLILMFVEAMVFYLAVIHGGSVSAMSYVSFAGTLISIILGLVAIFYTMIESLKQSNASDKIAAGASEIERNSNKMSQEVERLSESIQIISEISSRVRNIETITGSLASGFSGKSAVEIQVPENIENVISNSIKSHFFLGPMCAALCHLCAVKNIRGPEFVTDESFIRVSQKILECARIDFEPFKLAFFIYLRLFQSMGVFSVDQLGRVNVVNGINYDAFLNTLDQIKDESPIDDGSLLVRNTQIKMLLKEASEYF